MKDKNIKPIDTVKYSHFKKCLTSLERDFKGRPEVLDNIDISFEYVIGSLFPNILSNIENTFAQNYIQGYNKGLSENFKSKYPNIKLIQETVNTYKDKCGNERYKSDWQYTKEGAYEVINYLLEKGRVIETENGQFKIVK